MISFVQPAFSDMKSQGLTLRLVNASLVSLSNVQFWAREHLCRGGIMGTKKGCFIVGSKVYSAVCIQFILVYTVYAPCVVSQHWLLRQWRNIPGHCGNLTFKQIVLCCQLSIDTSCDPLFAGIVDFHQKWNFSTT